MVKKDLCFLQMSEISGSLRPTTWPPVPHPPLGRKRGWKRRGNYRDPHNWPKPPGPMWLYLVKSLVQFNSQGTAGTTPQAKRGLSISAGGPGIQHPRSRFCAWARGRPTLRMDDRGRGDQKKPRRWEVFTTHERCLLLWCLPQPWRNTHLPAQTINSLFPKRVSCWAELQSGSAVFLRPDTTVPSGVSLVFWGEFFTFFNFCLPFSGLKVPLLMNWGLSSMDLVWPSGPSTPRVSPAEAAR